jgi:hypothetical protein
MVDSAQLCSSCGHLSPAVSEDCHSCADEFSEDDELSLEELNQYYSALDEGYGRYALYGYALAIGGPIVAIFAAGLLSVITGSSAVAGGVVLLGVFLAPVIGGSILMGSWAQLDGDFAGGVDQGVIRTVLKGFGLLVVFAIIVAIVSIIPIVNLIVPLGAIVLLLASPFMAYEFYKRMQVGQAEAVAALLAHGESRDGAVAEGFDSWEEQLCTSPDASQLAADLTVRTTDERCRSAIETALAVLASAPPSRVSRAEVGRRLDGVAEPAKEADEVTRGETHDAAAVERDTPTRDPETGAFTEAGADGE